MSAVRFVDTTKNGPKLTSDSVVGSKAPPQLIAAKTECSSHRVRWVKENCKRGRKQTTQYALSHECGLVHDIRREEGKPGKSSQRLAHLYLRRLLSGSAVQMGRQNRVFETASSQEHLRLYCLGSGINLGRKVWPSISGCLRPERRANHAKSGDRKECGKYSRLDSALLFAANSIPTSVLWNQPRFHRCSAWFAIPVEVYRALSKESACKFAVPLLSAPLRILIHL